MSETRGGGERKSKGEKLTWIKLHENKNQGEKQCAKSTSGKF